MGMLRMKMGFGSVNGEFLCRAQEVLYSPRKGLSRENCPGYDKDQRCKDERGFVCLGVRQLRVRHFLAFTGA